MFVVGVTGGIGSGKTAVTKRFQQLGITVVDADIVSRIIVEPDRPANKAIAAHFGSSVIEPNGTLNRRALRDIVFSNPEERVWLEQLTHPLIAGEIETRIACSQSPYTILVSPLLLESNGKGAQRNMVNRVLVIDAPKTLQIQRTTERDSTTKKGVEAIMKAQMSRQQRLQQADDIIINDDTLTALHQAVDQLHSTYLELATTHER